MRIPYARIDKLYRPARAEISDMDVIWCLHIAKPKIGFRAFCAEVQSIKHKYISRSHDFMYIDRMTAAIEFNVTAKRSSSRLFFEGSEIRS
jgi:hypothetical protein